MKFSATLNSFLHLENFQRMCFLDAIASPGSYPCRVSGSVMLSELSELVSCAELYLCRIFGLNL